MLIAGALLPARLQAVAPDAPVAGAAAAQELRLHAFTLEHQRAVDAMSLVLPLLSPRGTVEVQPASNTLLVRDTLGALAAITTTVRSFDHPARPLTLTLQVVQAEGGMDNNVSPPAPVRASGLPAELVERLRKMLPYGSYALVAGAEFGSHEGQPVTYDLAGRYRVAFQLGNVSDARRLRIGNFRVERLDRGTDEPLIHTNLNLTLGQTTVLGLARESTSPRALMVVLLAKLGPVDPSGAEAP